MQSNTIIIGPTMVFLGGNLFFLTLFPLAFAQRISDPGLFPRPLIIDINQVQLHCTSWRFAVESNNLSPWKKIPEECGDYVREYMTRKGYGIDLQRVCDEAKLYARSVDLSGDEKFAWIFDVDETLLSNLPYYNEHGYGLEIFDSTKFDEWVDMGMAPAIESSLKLYEEVVSLGFKVIILGGRSERKLNITIENLLQAGFRGWDKLILRSSKDHGEKATIYKSKKRKELVEQGYKIMGNSGDQWSDLSGPTMPKRSFKLPNPMYHIP